MCELLRKQFAFQGLTIFQSDKCVGSNPKWLEKFQVKIFPRKANILPIRVKHF
jgi:hypothetical protein